MSAAESLTRAVLRVVASDDMLEGFAVADETFDGDETQLVEVLRAAGFHGPVDADGIALFLSDLPVGVPVRVLRGRRAVAGSDSKLEYVFKSLAPREPSGGASDGREEFAIDHRESRALEKCSAGEVLVRKLPGPTPSDGVDVYGRTIPAERGKELKLVAGTNATLSPDGLCITAAIDGVPMRESNGRVLVNAAVTVKQVDFKSGNIHFDGSVIVEGDVLQGFSVEATGDIHIKGSVENAQIRAGGSVIIGGGVRRHSLIRAAVDVEARFSDSESHIEARRTVRIAQNAIQSELIGDESVVIGGQLVAGRVQSWNLVEAGVLGCPHGSLTVVNVERPNGGLRIQALREELGLAKPANETGEADPKHPSGIRPVNARTRAPTIAPSRLPQGTVAPRPPTRGPIPGSLARLPAPGTLGKLPAARPAALKAPKAPTDARQIVRSKVTIAIERRELEQLLEHAERVQASPASSHGRVVAKTAVRPGVTVSIAHDMLAVDADLGARSFFVGEEGIVEAPLAVAPASSPKLAK